MLVNLGDKGAVSRDLVSFQNPPNAFGLTEQ